MTAVGFILSLRAKSRHLQSDKPKVSTTQSDQPKFSIFFQHLQFDKPKAKPTQSTKIGIVPILYNVLVRSTSSLTNCSKFPAAFLVIQRLMSFELVAGPKQNKICSFFSWRQLFVKRQLAFHISCLRFSCCILVIKCLMSFELAPKQNKICSSFPSQHVNYSTLSSQKGNLPLPYFLPTSPSFLPPSCC